MEEKVKFAHPEISREEFEEICNDLGMGDPKILPTDSGGKTKKFVCKKCKDDSTGRHTVVEKNGVPTWRCDK